MINISFECHCAGFLIENYSDLPDTIVVLPNKEAKIPYRSPEKQDLVVYSFSGNY
jgi:hypothetical protein